MRLPSPDEALIALSDRILAGPQRRGRPLPALLVPVHLGAPIAACVAAVALAFTGDIPLIPGWVALAGVQVVVAAKAIPRLMADARRWDASLAARYRSRALSTRAEPMLRAILLAATAVSALWECVVADAHGLVSADSAYNLGFMAMAASMATTLYARCAMPRDPDATARAGLPSAA